MLAPLLAVAAVAAPAPHLPSAPTCPIFPVSNPWNQRVDGLPVAADSARIVEVVDTRR